MDVYGRYNELVFMGVILARKATNISGGAHPVGKPEVIIRNYFFGGLLVKPMEGN